MDMKFIEKEKSLLSTNPKYSVILDSWLSVHRLQIQASTAYGYEKNLPRIKDWFGNVVISDVTEQMVYDFVQSLLASDLAYTSTKGYCKIVKMSLRHAVRYGYISFSPADYVRMPSKRRAEVHAFTAGEISLLLSAEGPQWVKDGIVIASRTGMRPGEIYALKWSDINFDMHFISVQRAISRACSATKTTKTPAGVRRIDIDSKLTQYLQNMRNNAKGGYVFPAPPLGHQEYRVPWNLAEKMKKMCIRAGIQPRNFYALRHSHATILLEMGVHPKIVQERLGHSSSVITLDTYSHVAPTLQSGAVGVMEDVDLIMPEINRKQCTATARQIEG